MNDKTNIFNIELNNIPLINIRMEFNNTYQILCSTKFYHQIKNNSESIDLTYLQWYTRSGSLLSLILQRAITGIESYICGATYYEGGVRGLIHRHNEKYIKNPFLLKGHSTADNYYNKLPGLLHDDLRLKIMDKKLWKKTLKYYREIRNPIFHGYEISKSELKNIYEAFVLMAEIYEWIDLWHPPENLVNGGSIFQDIKKKFKPEWLKL